MRDIQTYLGRYDGTPAAAEARLLLAEVAIRAGQSQDAIAAVQPLADDLSDPLGTPAAFLLGAAQEAAQQHERAVDVYLRIAGSSPFAYQTQRALDHAARVRLEQDNPTAAVELYDRLLANIAFDSPDRQIYEMRRAEAQARASTPAR
jgi:tetratricopeptide (TPR) repeat protein